MVGRCGLTYLVPALADTTREANKVIRRGALIRGGGAAGELSIPCAVIVSTAVMFCRDIYIFSAPLLHQRHDTDSV